MSSSSSSEDEAPKKNVTQKKKDSKKRTRDDSSSDEGPIDRNPTKKTKKEGGRTAAKRMTNDDGDEMIEIGSNRYVTVRSFRGKPLIDVREFYVDKGSGKLKPGKKGISLTKEQYENFKAVMGDIEEKLKAV